ncbi:hypothetical protein JCM11251_002436 [Rhodosporidiobolus azoricus]
MFALRTAALARGVRPTARNVRAFHVENKVNNNLPFKYEGESKRRFTYGMMTIMSLGFAVPFLAAAFQVHVLHFLP